jgi:hypothetical protein
LDRLAKGSSGQFLKQGATTAAWASLVAATDVSDFAEAVSDQVGAMVTGNTETGITVAYQDADNTLDFTVGINSNALFSAGVVDAAALASDAVTTVKILDSNVTTGKLASNAVTTVKVTDANITAAKLEASLPRGAVAAPVQVTANQGSISSSFVDLTSLTITFTPVSGTRYIRAEGFAHFTSGTANDVLVLAVREGSTVLASTSVSHVAGTTSSTARVVAYVTPTLAAHTYKLSAQLASGTGPFTMSASANVPANFAVTDIGGT